MHRASQAHGAQQGTHFYAAVADLIEAFFDTEAEAFEIEDAAPQGVFA